MCCVLCVVVVVVVILSVYFFYSFALLLRPYLEAHVVYVIGLEITSRVLDGSAGKLEEIKLQF